MVRRTGDWEEEGDKVLDSFPSDSHFRMPAPLLGLRCGGGKPDLTSVLRGSREMGVESFCPPPQLAIPSTPGLQCACSHCPQAQMTVLWSHVY